jgi:hypothetical protein
MGFMAGESIEGGRGAPDKEKGFGCQVEMWLIKGLPPIFFAGISIESNGETSHGLRDWTQRAGFYIEAENGRRIGRSFAEFELRPDADGPAVFSARIHVCVHRGNVHGYRGAE